MKREEKRLLLSVVGNVMMQYISTLKAHKQASEEKFNPKSGYAWTNNVVKCGKGIEYAERILDNLRPVLFREKEWGRKELISVFHDKNYNPDVIGFGWHETTDPDRVAQNAVVVLGSMGISAPEIFASIIGYSLTRGEKELLDGEKWEGEVNTGSFGKIGVNYGLPKDFDVLFASDHTQMNVDLTTPYAIIRRYLARELRATNSNNDRVNKMIFNRGLENVTFGLYPRQYGTYRRWDDPMYSYQKTFETFRDSRFKLEEKRNPHTEPVFVRDDELDMIG